ncbi:MAG: HU family DNA-binding protein [Mucinivorans sp.]
MTKAELVSEIAKNTGIEKVLIMEVVENFMEGIKKSMIGGDNVYLRGFGSFILKARAEKTARNISRNVAVTVPAHNIPAFKPAKEFKDVIKTQK